MNESDNKVGLHKDATEGWHISLILKCKRVSMTYEVADAPFHIQRNDTYIYLVDCILVYIYIPVYVISRKQHLKLLNILLTCFDCIFHFFEAGIANRISSFK